MVLKKLLTLTFVLNLVSNSLQSSYIQDDILAFPRYKVIVTKEKVANTDVGLKQSLDNNIIMTSSLGQPFYCSIPNVQVEEDRIEREKKEIEEEEAKEDIQKTIDRGLELLEPLGMSCIRFKTSTNQYWAYEYCHNQYVRQFHIERNPEGKHEEEKETSSYYLGIYPGLSQADAQSLYKSDDKAVSKPAIKPTRHAKAITQLKSDKEERYLVQTWQDGSVCDITEKPRTIEVQYRCDNQGPDRVSSFMEVYTCNYQIVISTPRLCEEMSLSRRHYTEPHQIKCRPIVSEKLIEQEKQKEEEEQAIPQEEPIQEKANEEQEEKVKENQQQDFLLGMISELTEQINQLKVQMNTMPDQAEVSFLSFDEQGNLINDPDFTKLIKNTLEKSSNMKPITLKAEEKPNDQHENKEAYHQKYIVTEE